MILKTVRSDMMVSTLIRSKKPDLRRSLGIILQDTNLFTGTVMDNIRYGYLEATDEQCIEAAKLAGADDFITRLPDGYNTMLTGNGQVYHKVRDSLLRLQERLWQIHLL